MAGFKNIFVIFLLLEVLQSLAQGGWKRQYYPDQSVSSTANNVFESPDGNIITLGFTYNSQVSQGYLTFIISDKDGNQLSRKDYGSSSLSYALSPLCYHVAVVQESSAFFVLVPALESGSNRAIACLIKFNYNCDSIWQKRYRESAPDDLIPTGLAAGLDNSLLFTGFSQQQGNAQASFLIKTDMNGQELWRQKYNKVAPDVQWGLSLVQDRVSKKILIGGTHYVGDAQTFASEGMVLTTDSLGTFLDRRTYNNIRAGGFPSIIQLEDANFLVSGSWHDQIKVGTDLYRGLIAKFDINGSLIWSRKVNRPSMYNYISFIVEDPVTKDIYGIGTLDTLQQYQMQDISDVQFTRLNSNGGIIEVRKIGSATTGSKKNSEQPISLRRTKDKGFIVASVFLFVDKPGNFSIIKLDSTGCDSTEQYCQMLREVSVNKNERSSTGIDFFPNPATDKLFINSGSLSSGETKITFSDVAGREIKTLFIETSDKELDISDLPGGIYFVSLYAEEKRIGVRKLSVMR